MSRLNNDWEIKYLQDAKDDLKKLDGSQKPIVIKAIRKVAANPLPENEGGYGKPLGHKNNINLTGLLKIKIKSLGIRVVYRLVKSPINKIMNIIVVSVREDMEVYKIAAKRIADE